MTSLLFVCQECEKHITDPYHKYVERTEFRRLDGKVRTAAHTERYLCLDCVGQRVQQMKGQVRDDQQELI